jgi:hypothetical protein
MIVEFVLVMISKRLISQKITFTEHYILSKDGTSGVQRNTLFFNLTGKTQKGP